jgi:hypothetical protein
VDGLKGRELAEEALRIYRTVEAKYRRGITVPELLDEIHASRQKIAAPNFRSALQSALNDSQARGVWQRVGRGTWLPGSGVDRTNSGLSGKPLADATYAFVRERYPNGQFHYGIALDGLEAAGVAVKGTGHVMLAALKSAPDRFEKLPGRKGLWRWK